MSLNAEILELAEDFLKKVRKDIQPYTSNRIELTVGKSQAKVEIPSHIQFARYGRGPGKQPPVDEILAWVKREGIATAPTEQLGTAWAIAKSIAKNGTKNYVSGAPNFVDEVIKKYEDDFIDDVAELTADNVAEQLIDSLEQIFGSKGIEVDINLR